MTIIGIDPGHGGSDPGAIGPTGVQEKDITLEISRVLASLLRRTPGISTYQTRCLDDYLTLSERSSILNALDVDYVISIHCNAFYNSNARYISTFVQALGGNAEKLARAVQTELVVATGWPDGGVKVSNLHMTRETKAPAILVECGFISNPEQEKMLAKATMQALIARAIYAGIMKHLGRAIEPVDADPWKYDIVAKAVDMGLLDHPHDPDEPAPKWFVLDVVMDAMRAMKAGDI